MTTRYKSLYAEFKSYFTAPTSLKKNLPLRAKIKQSLIIKVISHQVQLPKIFSAAVIGAMKC